MRRRTSSESICQKGCRRVECRGNANNVGVAVHPKRAQPARDRGGGLLSNHDADVRVVRREPWMSSKDESRKRFEGRAEDERPNGGNRTQSTHTRMQGTRARDFECRNLNIIRMIRILPHESTRSSPTLKISKGRSKSDGHSVVFESVYTVGNVTEVPARGPLAEIMTRSTT
jgi:hypothetical protein